MDNARLKAILDASTLLFIQQGYSRTQISHIAKAAGVSVGTIYNVFTGKQEIMHFFLKCTIDPEFIKSDFKKPITDDLFHDLEKEIMQVFAKTADDFSSRYLNRDGGTFESLVSDAFDMLSRYAAGCLFIEKNPFDCGRLLDSYKTYRTNFFNTMTRCMSRFIDKGIVRPIKHLELTTSLIIEMLAWWAMDMRFNSFENYDIPLEMAKEVCMDNVTSAYKMNPCT